MAFRLFGSTRAPRDTYTYRLIHKGRVVYYGITREPSARWDQHARAGKVFDSLDIIGRAKTKAGAKAAEETLILTHVAVYGRRPKYNLTFHG
jgi:hypothetical protein